MMAAMVELSGGWKMILAVLIGFGFGFSLVKTGLCDPKRLRQFLLWRDAELWQSLAGATFFAALFTYFLRCRNALPVIHSGGSYVALLLGGALCGIGMMMAGATPLTSLASLASGRLQALWFFLGGAVAVWGIGFLGDVQEWLPRFGGAVRPPRIPREFWLVENPLVWVAGSALAVLLIALISGRFRSGSK